jgi:hypothetical protein
MAAHMGRVWAGTAQLKLILFNLFNLVRYIFYIVVKFGFYVVKCC